MPKPVLKRQTRKMIYDVHTYLKKETEGVITSLKKIQSQVDKAADILLNDKGTNLRDLKKTALTIKLENMDIFNFISDFKKLQKRTADATNTSVATVRNIFNESKHSDLVFRTPGKKRYRDKRITNVDNFNQGVIKRLIHNYHIINKQQPTIGKLKLKLQKDINFKGSESSLRRIIKNLGFRSKKIENNQKILIESTNIRLQRIEYLKKIKQYRQEGRPIVYTDESYIDLSHSVPKACTDGNVKGVKRPVSKGQRVVVVNAGSEAGFIPNALLTFQAGSMNYQNYEKWLRTHLMPNLPPNSVVVVDNAAYHNKQVHLAPTSNSKKSIMQAWLTEKGIPYDINLLKPELYKIIKSYKEGNKTYSINQILLEQNHDVLRLPSYHPDLNPIEMAWSSIKQYVAIRNVNGTLNDCTDLIKEKVSLMNEHEWKILCEKVKTIEADYAKSDYVIDLLTDQVIICDDDECTDGDTSDSSSDDDCFRDSPERGPSTSKMPCPSSDSARVISNAKHDDIMDFVHNL